MSGSDASGASAPRDTPCGAEPDGCVAADGFDAGAGVAAGRAQLATSARAARVIEEREEAVTMGDWLSKGNQREE